MNIELSIIVPVYNSEKTLDKCIKSILNQSYKQFELILINDGSIDASLSICNKYMNTDKRIQLITQPNKGVSATRNTGLKNAKGKYIKFLDSDDWIGAGMFEYMMCNIDSKVVDLVMCGYRRIEYKDNIKIDEKEITPNNEDSIIKNEFFQNLYLYFEKELISPLWNKIFKKEIIQEFDIKFDENLSLGEDLLFNLEYLKQVKSIKTLEKPFYNYIIFNDGKSLSTRYNPKRLEAQIIMHTTLINLLKENGCYNDGNEKYFEVKFSKAIIGAMRNFIKNNNKGKIQTKKYLKEICNDPQVIDNIRVLKNGSVDRNIIAIMLKLKVINILTYLNKILV